MLKYPRPGKIVSKYMFVLHLGFLFGHIVGLQETGANAPCRAGGGSQTRTVTCSRSDGSTQNDDNCTRLVSTKPITQQSCNTQACVTKECQYKYPFDENDKALLKGGITRYKGYDENYNTMTKFGEQWNWFIPPKSSTTIWGNMYANNNQSTEQVTSGGYLYTRGTQRLPWGQYTDVEGDYTWWAFWEICRVPV